MEKKVSYLKRVVDRAQEIDERVYTKKGGKISLATPYRTRPAAVKAAESENTRKGKEGWQLRTIA